MKIQLNTDDHIDSTEALAVHVRATLAQVLKRFDEHITRVEVHLSDKNADKSGSSKSGQADKCCLLEARLEGRQPVAVKDQAPTVEQALNGAAQKLANLLDSTLGRLGEHRAKPSNLPLTGGEPTGQ